MQDLSKNKLIIVAEDSLTQAERLKHMLEGSGYEISHVLNGREALIMASVKKFHFHQVPIRI